MTDTVLARRFPGMDADMDLQVSFDNWLIRNQGDCFFRYISNRLIIGRPHADPQPVAKPGDWIVREGDTLFVYTPDEFDSVYESAEE